MLVAIIGSVMSHVMIDITCYDLCIIKMVLIINLGVSDGASIIKDYVNSCEK